MNLQELSTLMHNNIKIDIFLINNGGYQTIKQTQQLGFKSNFMGCDEKSGISFIGSGVTATTFAEKGKKSHPKSTKHILVRKVSENEYDTLGHFLK